MSRILEAMLSRLMDILTSFENIKARRGDDEISARYRYLQRACIWAGALWVCVVLLSLVAGSVLDALDDVFQHASTLEDLRSDAFALAMTAFAATSAYAVFCCCWRLWRFWRDEGMA